MLLTYIYFSAMVFRNLVSYFSCLLDIKTQFLVICSCMCNIVCMIFFFFKLYD